MTPSSDEPAAPSDEKMMSSMLDTATLNLSNDKINIAYVTMLTRFNGALKLLTTECLFGVPNGSHTTIIDSSKVLNSTVYTASNHLLIASFFGMESKVEQALRDPDCNVNAVDKNGWTALHHVAAMNHCKIAVILMKAGADFNIRSISNDTPLDVAFKRKNINIYKVLKMFSENMDIPMDEIDPLKSMISNKMFDKPSKPASDLKQLPSHHFELPVDFIKKENF